MDMPLFLLNRLPGCCLPQDRPLEYAGALYDGHHPLQRYLDRADQAGFPRNTAYPVRALRGRLSGFRGEVLFTTPGSHSEHRVLLSLLSRAGVDLHEVFCGEATPEAGEQLLHELQNVTGVSPALAATRQKQRAGTCRKLLNAIRDGSLYGLPLQRAVLAMATQAVVQQPLPVLPVRHCTRLALLGTPVPPSLFRWLESRGAVTVLTEETAAELEGTHPDLLETMAGFPLASHGLRHRFARLTHWLEQTGATGVVFLMTPLSHEYLEFEFCRQLLPCPVLALEIAEPGPPDRRTRLRLDAFLEVIR